MNRKYTKCTHLRAKSKGLEEENYIMKYAIIFMIPWLGIKIIVKKYKYTNGSCTHIH